MAMCSRQVSRAAWAAFWAAECLAREARPVALEGTVTGVRDGEDRLRAGAGPDRVAAAARAGALPR
jgi:hypothetical protein